MGRHGVLTRPAPLSMSLLQASSVCTSCIKSYLSIAEGLKPSYILFYATHLPRTLSSGNYTACNQESGTVTLPGVSVCNIVVTSPVQPQFVGYTRTRLNGLNRDI
jgi:hypothetical protein